MFRSVAFWASIAILLVIVTVRTRTTLYTDAAELGRDNESELPHGPDHWIVHEWGTFTTFSGSDGVFLDFRPLSADSRDLPNYVLDRGSLSQSLFSRVSKSRLRGRVRMETPVTYFYTDRPRTVDVRVDFPEGLLTEFYPPVRGVQPPIDEENIFNSGELIGKSSLNWGSVDLIPTSQFAPDLDDDYLNNTIIDRIVSKLLPHAVNEQHYAAARETDSALVHVQDATNENSYFEKFLFYRGVGKFQLPITTRFEQNVAIIENAGSRPIRSAILINIEGVQIQANRISQVAPGQSVAFAGLQNVTDEELAELVRGSLVAEGLYQKEAASMVKTWKESWFTEPGMRVLYMLPQSVTEELLPLHISPQPPEMLRVLVGRMELMSPSQEQVMIDAVTRSATARSKHNVDQLANGSERVAFPIATEIRAFGRMTEPALARVAAISNDDGVRKEANLLLKAIQPTPILSDNP